MKRFNADKEVDVQVLVNLLNELVRKNLDDKEIIKEILVQYVSRDCFSAIKHAERIIYEAYTDDRNLNTKRGN